MIDNQFARHLFNRWTIAGVVLVASAVGLMVAHVVFLGRENNLGFGPFAAPLMVAGIIVLAIGAASALRKAPRPHN